MYPYMGVNDVRRTEMHTAEPLVPELSAFEVELAILLLLLLLQSALQPLVGFGLLYDFVAQSSIFTLLSPVSHFHLL